jgi:hypothetical protein
VGQESARLREEIDRTREDLTRDVDLLAEKTSPSRIVERRVQRTRRGLVGLKEKVMGTSDAEHRSSYGPTYTDDVYATGSGYRGAGYEESGGGVSATLGWARGSASGAASHAVDSTRESLSHAKDQVSHAGERAQGAAHGAVTGVREQTEGNPFAAGLVAFGVGWLVSSLMPASEAETQAAHRAGDLAREHGGPVVELARQAAQEVGQELQGHAQEAAQQVKERTQEATENVREEARTSASS